MWIWRQRFRARRALWRNVRLVYHPTYAMHGLRGHAISRSALDRGERIIAALAGRGLLRPGDVEAAPMAELLELSRAHDLSYLESLNDPSVLGRIFGVDAPEMIVDLPLYAQRHAVGGTLLATEIVTGSNAEIAINLGGGLHHAHRARGAGFCSYNDVAVAVAELRRSGYEAPIAVVDLDFHQGDGTESMFARDPSVFTYSIHGAQWQDIEAVASKNVELPPRTRDGAYLQALAETLPDLLRKHRPGLVFYLAGNDVLADDTLGDFSLSPLGVLHRDKRVLDWSRSLGAKVVITLAGGYGDLAWRASMNLVRFVLTDYFSASAEAIDVRRKHYEQIAQELDPSDLQYEDDPLEFTEEDIVGGLLAPKLTQPVFGYYTKNGIETALQMYGFLDLLRERGFEAIRMDGDTSDTQRQRLRIYGRKRGYENAGELLLMELVAGRRILDAPEPLGRIDVLYVEWLLLQDPTRGFDSMRPRLPGQQHPGLGLVREMLELLRLVCKRLDLDAVASQPANFHNALVIRDFRFLDPAAEGRFQAIRRALSRFSMVDATHAIDRGHLRTTDGESFTWTPAPHVLPVSDRMHTYFASEAYEEEANRVFESWKARELGVGREAPTSEVPSYALKPTQPRTSG